MEVKVSIIVPIYNVEKYLPQCVESLINQTLKDIEIILVDDGSPDKSGQIAEEYAKKDKRIKVVHQENAGLGPARNSGIENATGEYIGFVDSDDWANSGMFEKLYNVAQKENADIVVSGNREMENGLAVKLKPHPLAGKTVSDLNEIDSIRKKLYGHGLNDSTVEAFPMAVWIAIYKRKMLVDNNLVFKEIFSEDTIFNLRVYKYAKIISFTNETDYCYRTEGQPSIMRTFANNKLMRYRDFLQTLFEMAKEENDDECIIRAKRTAIAYCRLYVGLVNTSNNSFSNKKKYVEEFAKSEDICCLWMNYPIQTLPVQQRLFQQMIQIGWYGMALWMTSLRQIIKKNKIIRALLVSI